MSDVEHCLNCGVPNTPEALTCIACGLLLGASEEERAVRAYRDEIRAAQEAANDAEDGEADEIGDLEREVEAWKALCREAKPFVEAVADSWDHTDHEFALAWMAKYKAL